MGGGSLITITLTFIKKKNLFPANIHYHQNIVAVYCYKACNALQKHLHVSRYERNVDLGTTIGSNIIFMLCQKSE